MNAINLLRYILCGLLGLISILYFVVAYGEYTDWMELLDGKEYSIQQIASLLELPISSTYRKVNRLEQIKNYKKKQRLCGRLTELMNLYILLGLTKFKSVLKITELLAILKIDINKTKLFDYGKLLNNKLLNL